MQKPHHVTDRQTDRQTNRGIIEGLTELMYIFKNRGGGTNNDDGRSLEILVEMHQTTIQIHKNLW